MFVRNLLLVILPALIVVAWASRGDLGIRVTILCLALGAGAVIVALGLGLVIPNGLVSRSGIASQLLRSFVLVGLVEELSRLVAILVARSRLRSGNRRDSLRVGVIVGSGFAITESLLILGRATDVLALRALTALPLHAAAGGIIGFLVGLSTGSEEDQDGLIAPVAAILLGLVTAVIVHGSYDLLLSLGSSTSLLAILLLAVATAAVPALDHLSPPQDRARPR